MTETREKVRKHWFSAVGPVRAGTVCLIDCIITVNPLGYRNDQIRSQLRRVAVLHPVSAMVNMLRSQSPFAKSQKSTLVH